MTTAKVRGQRELEPELCDQRGDGALREVLGQRSGAAAEAGTAIRVQPSSLVVQGETVAAPRAAGDTAATDTGGTSREERLGDGRRAWGWGHPQYRPSGEGTPGPGGLLGFQALVPAQGGALSRDSVEVLVGCHR